VQQHLKPRRIWDFSHSKVALSEEEEAHIRSCAACLQIFKLSILSDKPKDADEGDTDVKRHSA
jgi:hypothetical protein